MSDPEIDRRCTTCGATVRSRALFCPQCGQPVARHDELADTIDLKRPEANRSVSETADTIAIDRSMLDAPSPTTVEPPATVASSYPSIPIQSPSTQPGSRRAHGAVDTDARGRVERLRKASTVVIEQAHYDPSLRFLLVTAGLFLLFLLLLVLSKMLG